MKYGVFISYSHEDVNYVSPIVRLVRAMRSDLVFQDTVDIKPGKKWEPQLQCALEEAEVLIIFWCKHAAESAYVKKEYESAIAKNKDILPLLLDDCDLAVELSPYQWIDLRDVIFHNKTIVSPDAPSVVGPDAAPSTMRKRSKTLYKIVPILALVSITVMLILFTTFKNYNEGGTSYDGSADTVIHYPNPDPLGERPLKDTGLLSEKRVSNIWFIVLPAVALVIITIALIYKRQKRSSFPVPENERAVSSSGNQVEIAQKLNEALKIKIPVQGISGE